MIIKVTIMIQLAWLVLPTLFHSKHTVKKTIHSNNPASNKKLYLNQNYFFVPNQSHKVFWWIASSSKVGTGLGVVLTH